MLYTYAQNMTKNKQYNFKDDFFWGASTAAHQVEGGNHNQWTVWELENASRLASEAGGRNNPVSLPKTDLKIWPQIKDTATKPENYVSGDGVKHYQLYKEDFKILKSLNMNAFRFTIEWSRLEPKEGQWDEHEIKHYHDYIDELNRQGVEPFLNIWHWTAPVWFIEKGDFTKKSNIKYFDRLVRKIVDEYGSKVRYIITVNEANTYTLMSYSIGMWPPMKKNPLQTILVYKNLVRAHKNAYKIIKNIKPQIQVGLAHQSSVNRVLNKYNLVGHIVALGSDYFWYVWFYNRCRKYQDFVGSNFYQTNYIKGWKIKNPETPVSDIGWYMEPYAINDVIKKLYKKYKKPILITENGVADMNDEYRKWWIEETVKAMDDAIGDGAQMLGYLHWSLLDNFEWAEGWWLKFGLVEVQREHGMKRTIRPSAKWFAQTIAEINDNTSK